MSRLCLIFPRFRYPSGDPPLGVAYLAAAVKAWTDWEVDLIDTTFFKNPTQELENRLMQGDYDAVGVSFMTPMLRDAFLTAQIARRVCPQAAIIAGGPHSTVDPEHVLSNPDFDMVVVGEGEATLTELLKRNCQPDGVTGIVLRKNDRIQRNELRPVIQDLDSLPLPALHLLDMESYKQSWFLLDSVKTGLKGTSIMASRGCPYQCAYCQPTLETLFGRKLRRRTPANIVEELVQFKEKFGLNAFALQDDTFLINKRWVIEVCSAMEQADLNMIWECNLRANLVDEEVLSAMRRAGLRKVNIGIESANQRILDEVFQKQITWENVEEAINVCNKLKLKIQGYFMLGAPSETMDEVMNTIRTAARLNLDDATFSITTPLPHTFLFDRTRSLIDREFEDYDYYSTSVYKQGAALSSRKLFWLKRMAFFRFYLAPKRIFKTLAMVFNPKNISRTLVKLKRL